MKKALLSFAVALIIAAICFSFSLPAIADFGNFDSYDSGSSGGFDFGGSSDFDFDSGSSYDYGSSSYDSNGNDDDDDFSGIITIVAIIIIGYFIFRAVSKSKGGNTASTTVSAPMRGSYVNKTAEIEQLIQKDDPAFTSGKFISFIKECYVKLQVAWTARDVESIRLLQSDELFSQSKSQIEEYIRLGRINVMERVAVNNVFFTDYRRDESKEYVDVLLNATQKDYIIDEKSKAIIEGSNSVYRNINYIITFMRAAGEKTPSGEDNSEGVKSSTCPNCGATLEITATGKCPYCGSVISSDSHAWVISAMKRA